MKRLVVAVPLLLVACNGGDGETDPATGDPGAGALELEVEGEVLTPAEAAAEAEREITQENADAELEKLEQEIEQGGG